MTKKQSESSHNKPSTSFASSNWLALRKTLQSKKNEDGRPRKRRKLDHSDGRSSSPTPSTASSNSKKTIEQTKSDKKNTKNGESLLTLQAMILGQVEHTESQQEPGKYLAVDCEMVGVGIDGAESSLARVSVVNFYGFVLLDEFVKQRERVVDYRTQYSGIRHSDMKKAKPFVDVQKRVANLLKDRILVGHAIHNDLKALLLSHPHTMIRDTQRLAVKNKVVKSKFIALRHLVKQELDVTIQAGEHSSVTDARATMAIYRLHKKDWEKGLGRVRVRVGVVKKRKKEVDVDEFPGGGKKGVSSGLSTVTSTSIKKKWWKELAS